MDTFLNAIQYIVDLGPSVMLPLIIFVLALCLRQSVAKSLRSALTIGVGFVGISLVVDLLTSSMGPAAQAMADNWNLGLTVVDLGWPGTSPMAWASNLGLVAIPVAIAVNVVMLLTKTTRVLNVDIWNIWHMAFTGAIVQIATGSFWLGILGVAIHAAIAYKLGDMWGKVTDNYFGLEGVAIPHGTSAYMGVFATVVDDAIEKIPGLNKINLTTEKLEERMGVFGEPLIIGSILGFIIGLLGGYPIGDSLKLAVEMGAVMLLMPMVVKLIMQGLMPVADSAKKILQKRFSNGEFRIGLDPALLLGQPQVISASLIFIPWTVILAALIPGNTVLPFGDLATIGFFVAMAVGVHKGNMFRTLISGTFIMVITIWISNQMVGLQTQLASDTGLLGGASQVGSLDQGGSPLTYLLAKGLSGEFGIGLLVILVLYVGAFAYTYVKYRKGTIYRTDEEIAAADESAQPAEGTNAA
ncbi:PTS galactitol transporter subunit IIC [Corynebacterium sp. HMSC056F09]|uniref:PTS galactitol transporter subunit IIC n=1 Tax=Corynebacterium TaxID=1716 RepID=UPI0006655F72|nr:MULTISPECIES: PTS transporter subunit IIC [Corynebacterium]OFN75682.1 PTS galactitol transporter subunit IIC [Corynebacterium sp. HMSC074E01]OFO22227.1 PTS galactitol transporter subunit IIC [Corynebacterium sp. HMSC056F09]